MNTTIKRVWRQDKLLPIDDLSGYAFTGESDAHVFVISGKNAEGPVGITGDITATFLNAGNVTVPLTGSITDGSASVTLIDSCYVVPGRFILTIYAGSVAIYCAVGTVMQTNSDRIEYPSASIPDIEALINSAQAAASQIQGQVTTAQAAVAAAQAAVDGIEDQRQTMIDAIASVAEQGTDTTLSQSGVAADAKAAGDQISDLKSAMKTVDGAQIETDWSIGYAYKTASSVTQIQPTDKTATTNFGCISVSCSDGDVFYLTGTGGGGEKLWVWLKSDGTIIDRAASSAVGNNLELVAPYGAAYLLSSVDVRQAYQLVSGASVDYRINGVDDKLNAEIKKNDATNYETNSYALANVYYGTVGSGSELQVRNSTTSYNGLIIPIPRGIQTIDLSDMTPYYAHAFSTFPELWHTNGVQLTITNKTISIPVDNEYAYIIVTLNMTASGNDKATFAISMKKTFDERIRTVEYKINPIKSGRTLPIVCFVYDDNPDGDTTLHDMLEERGLKGTFATIGNVDKDNATWKTTATRLQEWVRQGHGVIGHGLTVGVDVTILDGDTLPGISNISDADARKAIEANNAALDAYGLPHNGIAYWNVWEDSPHTRAIVEKYYNYGFTFGGAGSGKNTLMTDLFSLTRWTTDLASHITDAVDYVNESIGQNRLLVFGGHMNRTGTGTGTYSTMAQFTSLLNAARDAVRNGDMISLNTDDAIRMFYGQNGNAGILNSYPYRPAVGNLVYDNGLKVCTNSGKAAFYRLTFSGTPQSGRLTIPEINIDVTVNASDTITDVVDRIISGTMCRNYTLEKTSTTQIWCYCDKSGAMNAPTVDVNTSGLSVAVSERQAGVNPVWS